VRAAKPGERIHVRAGRYIEVVRIDKSLELAGESADATIIQGKTGLFEEVFALVLVEANITLRNLSISMPYVGLGSRNSFAVAIASKGGLIEKCDISMARQGKARGTIAVQSALFIAPRLAFTKVVGTDCG
jgi:hypothetical protein